MGYSPRVARSRTRLKQLSTAQRAAGSVTGETPWLPQTQVELVLTPESLPETSAKLLMTKMGAWWMP